MRGNPMTPQHCTLGRREFNIENTPRIQNMLLGKINWAVNMPGLLSHDYSSFIQEAKNTRTNQTSRCVIFKCPVKNSADNAHQSLTTTNGTPPVS